MAKLTQVRKRKSYATWADLMDKFDKAISNPERIRAVREMMDTEHLFGSNKASEYSRESLEQVISDHRMGVLPVIMRALHGQD